VLWFLKRKPGISFEEFRDHYESVHSVLGQKYIGHLLIEYKRNYIVGAFDRSIAADGGGFGPKQWDFDCIAEWVTADEAAFNEIIRVMTDPRIGRMFADDEEKFLDREATMLIKCDARDTGPGDGAETLKLEGGAARPA
jgi:hypothetical protein